MGEKKNIDRLFQEKFKDYEVFPDTSVWENIEKRLSKKKKRRIVPLWFQIGGAAAVLLLLISTGFWFYNRQETTENPKENTVTKTGKGNKIKEGEKIKDKKLSTPTDNSVITYQKTNEKQQENDVLKGTQQYKLTKNNRTTTTSKKTRPVLESTIAETAHTNNKNKEAGSQADKNSKALQTSAELQKSEALAANTKTDSIAAKTTSDKTSIAAIITPEEKQKKVAIQEEIEKNKLPETVAKNTNKWSVGSTVAPVYYNSFGNGSPIDPALANNNKNGDGSISYGLKVNYKLSDKFSLQSGINNLELGYTTENVTTLVSSSLLAGTNTNIETNVNGVVIAAVSTVSQNSDALSQRASFDLSGSLGQSLSYVEIPLEIKYNMLQKKLGVNVIGGISTYFLYQNKVSITTFGKTTTLGEASNINAMNFSGNLGLDFDYNISKKLYINVSPMFKYQFNTFSKNAGGFKPYYLGIYTGVNFRF